MQNKDLKTDERGTGKGDDPVIEKNIAKSSMNQVKDETLNTM